VKLENVRKFQHLIETHPDGISHADVHNLWPGGGRVRPPMAEIAEIVNHFRELGVITIHRIPRKRGRPATIYRPFGCKPISHRSNRRSELVKEMLTDLVDGLEATAIDFLSKGKTLSQIYKKFGPSAQDEILNREYEGYDLFSQVNEANQRSYMLLPTPAKPVEVQPRAYAYHIGQDSKGRDHPYILVQLPDDAFQPGNFGNCVRIVPIFDAHYGHRSHRTKKFKHYLKWVEETPGLYGILGGDLMENAMDEGRGMAFDQDIPPQSQLDDLTEMLAPCSHKILAAMPGNHDARTQRKTGLNPARILAQRLQIPYFAGPVLISILAGGYKWRVYVSHGFTNPGTMGGKLNAAGKAAQFNGFVHFFLSGHTHAPQAAKKLIIREDIENACLKFEHSWTVVAQSFLGWLETYGYEKGWGPLSGGGVVLELYDNGEWLASLR